MKISSEDTLIAEDIYPLWEKLVANATDRIWIFTPYLDHTVRKLLSHSTTGQKIVCVITCLTTDIFIQHPQQIETVIELFGEGYSVLNCKRLHAKVLLADEEILAGSQNFTRYARTSKEVSSSHIKIANEASVKTLTSWKKEASKVDLKALLEIQAKLQPLLAKANLLKESAHELVGDENEVHEFLAEKVSYDGCFDEIKAGIEKSKSNQRDSQIFLQRTRLRGYDSLVVSGTRNFEISGFMKMVHPTLIAHSGKVRFCRIAETRISYIQHSLPWLFKFRFKISIKAREQYVLKLLDSNIDSIKTKVSARYIIENIKYANALTIHCVDGLDGSSYIRAKITNTRENIESEITLLLTGHEIKLVNHQILAINQDRLIEREFAVRQIWIELIYSQILGSNETLNDFVSTKILSPHQFSGRWNPNVHQYFSEYSQYKAQFIQCLNKEILLIEPT